MRCTDLKESHWGCVKVLHSIVLFSLSLQNALVVKAAALEAGKHTINPSVFLLYYNIYEWQDFERFFVLSLMFIARLHCLLRRLYYCAGIVPRTDRPLGLSSWRLYWNPRGFAGIQDPSKADPVNPVIQMLKNVGWVARISQLLLESKRVWEILLSLVWGSRLCVIVRYDAVLLGSWEQVWALSA